MKRLFLLLIICFGSFTCAFSAQQTLNDGEGYGQIRTKINENFTEVYGGLDGKASTSHASEHATGGTDEIAPADIGAATAAQGALAESAVQTESDPVAGAALTSHAGASDPHAGYLLESVLSADGLSFISAEDWAAMRGLLGMGTAYSYDVGTSNGNLLALRQCSDPQYIDQSSCEGAAETWSATPYFPLGEVIDASGFDGNLAPTDDTLQEVAQAFDDLTTGGTDDQTAEEVNITDAAGYYTATHVEGALAEAYSLVSDLISAVEAAGIAYISFDDGASVTAATASDTFDMIAANISGSGIECAYNGGAYSAATDNSAGAWTDATTPVFSLLADGSPHNIVCRDAGDTAVTDTLAVTLPLPTYALTLSVVSDGTITIGGTGYTSSGSPHTITGLSGATAMTAAYGGSNNTLTWGGDDAADVTGSYPDYSITMDAAKALTATFSESTTYTDNFDRADENPATGWTNVTGKTSLQVVSNAATATTGDSHAYYSASASGNNQFSAATFSTVATYSGVSARMQSGANTGYIFKTGGLTTLMRMYKVVDGTETQIVDNYSVSLQDGDVVRLEATGTSTVTLTPYINGSPLTAQTDSTDPIAEGSPGIFMAASAGGVVSTWSGGDL